MRILKTICVLALAAAAAAGPAGFPPGVAAQEKLTGPPKDRAKFMASRQGKLKAGDPAPDFVLPRRPERYAPGGRRVRGAQKFVRLSSFRGRKPVALIFGSYT